MSELKNYYTTDRAGVSVSVSWDDGTASGVRDALRLAGAMINDARLREDRAALPPEILPQLRTSDGGVISWAQQTGGAATLKSLQHEPALRVDMDGHALGAPATCPRCLAEGGTQPTEEKPCSDGEQHGAHAWNGDGDEGEMAEYLCPGEAGPYGNPGPAPEVNDGEWVRREP